MVAMPGARAPEAMPWRIDASWLLLGVGLLVALGGLPLWSHLRRSPVDPEGVLFRSLDENLEERTAALETLQRRRTTYGSDRRADDGPRWAALDRRHRSRVRGEGRLRRPRRHHLRRAVPRQRR